MRKRKQERVAAVAKEHRDDRVVDRKDVADKAEELSQEVVTTAEVLEYAVEKKAEELEKVRYIRAKRLLQGQLGAYTLIVLIGSYGFWQIEHDQYERCNFGNSLRDVSRGNASGIHDLILDLVEPPKGSPPRTPAQERRYNIFEKKLDKFESDQIAKVPKNRTCEEPSLLP